LRDRKRSNIIIWGRFRSLNPGALNQPEDAPIETEAVYIDKK
jgi:hypothetical protein